MALGIHEVLTPVYPVGRLPQPGGTLRPGLIQQFQAVLQVEINIGEIIREAAGHVHLLRTGIKLQPVTVTLTELLAQPAVQFKAGIEIDLGHRRIITLQGCQPGNRGVQPGQQRIQLA